MGALTSKPFSFAARSWELLDRLAYDCTDTFFSSVKVSFRGKTIIRVLPDFSVNLLSEWISDRVRFSYDSLENQSQLDTIYDFQLPKLSQNFICFFFKRFPTGSYFFDLVSANQLKGIFNFSGLSFQSFNNINFDNRNAYFFDFTQFSNTQIYKNYFFLGVNIRYQLPVFAVSFRKLVSSSEIFFFNFGFFTNNLLGDINLGSSIKSFYSTIRGKSQISRIYYSKESVIFSNPCIYSIISNYRTANIYTFFDNPKSLVSAETFSTLPSKIFNPISLFIPHFFSSYQLFPRYNKFQKFDSPISYFAEPKYNFYFISKKFSNFQNFYTIFPFTFDNSIFIYDNFYSHFGYSKFVKSSLNVLLALKRQTNFRSSFAYYT